MLYMGVVIYVQHYICYICATLYMGVVLFWFPLKRFQVSGHFLCVLFPGLAYPNDEKGIFTCCQIISLNPIAL